MKVMGKLFDMDYTNRVNDGKEIQWESIKQWGHIEYYDVYTSKIKGERMMNVTDIDNVSHWAAIKAHRRFSEKLKKNKALRKEIYEIMPNVGGWPLWPIEMTENNRPRITAHPDRPLIPGR